MNKEESITLKELFERLVALEAKFDMQLSKNQRTDRKFTKFAVLVILVEVVNMVFNYALYVKK